jgi:hypothetical protein
MLYRIGPFMTTNNFTTNLNEEISINDQYYAAKIYMGFIENDYKDCTKKITRQTNDSEYQLKCYQTWYQNCMIFVRDESICEIYRKPMQEYLYYLWLKNETSVDLHERRPVYYYFIHGIVYAVNSLCAIFYKRKKFGG